MDMLQAIIGPDEGASAQQLCVRAVLLFFFGVACVRIAGRKTFSRATPLDIVVALIVGSNISRVMTGKAAVIPALSATLVLVVLHRLMAWASPRWNLLAMVVKAKPTVLVRDGVADRKAMERHGVGEEDLLEGLRMEQLEKIEDARLAVLEGGGTISVVPKRKS